MSSIRRSLFFLSAALILITLLLAACGGGDKNNPPPTLANMDEMLTQLALQVSPTATAWQDTSTPAPTPTPTSFLPTATATTSEVQQQATGIVLTNTALAQVMPITQTVGAIRQATQAALGVSTAPPPVRETPTTVPTLNQAPQPNEPFQVVFYSNRYGNEDIFLMTLNGIERAVTSSAANEREPSCSPDGSMVVFASDASGSFQIYQLRFDRTDPIPLTNSEGMNFAPMYSPDGTTIAFVSTRNEGVPTIWLMDSDGGNQRQVTTGMGRDTSPNWGPDGKQLLFSSDQPGYWNLFMTLIDTDIEGEFPILPPEFSAQNQVWPLFDPLGERIAYTAWGDLADPQTSDLYLLDFEQPEPLPIRVGPGADWASAWGDDTHLLASVGGPDDVQVALVDITTGQAVPLTHSGTFNGGARLCTVQPSILPPEPTPVPSPTPTATSTLTPTLAPTATEAPKEPTLLEKFWLARGTTHIVQPGESLAGISYVYGVPWTAIASLNRLSNPNQLTIGQKLVIPVVQENLTKPPAAGSGLASILPSNKLIVVKLSAQRVYAYENGRLVRTALVSTGLPGTPTVKGDFFIYNKQTAQTMSGVDYYLPNVPYVMYFYQGYALHGTYWHSNFGQPMSHGCVNLPTDEARWFYDWAEIGTPVRVK